MENETTYEDELTPEQEDLLYLSRNPGIEQSLWGEWVCVCLDWKKMPHPTQAEWEWLKTT